MLVCIQLTPWELNGRSYETLYTRRLHPGVVPTLDHVTRDLFAAAPPTGRAELKITQSRNVSANNSILDCCVNV